MKASKNILSAGWKKEKERAKNNPFLTHFLHCEKETKEAGRLFAASLLPGDVISLIGDLGAGKTTFVKGIALYFGIEETIVSSPTFTYLQIYNHLAHFDLYRLCNQEQFFSMGFDEYFSPPFIALIEWPEVIQEKLPNHSYTVTLQHQEGGRSLEISRM